MLQEVAAVPASIALTEPHTVWTAADNAATDASIAAYLGAGDRMASAMGIVMKLCAVVAVLLAAAWILGFLPIAVRWF